MPFAVTDRHVAVPRGERGTVTVAFDDAYVWSFVGPRDGTWTPAGRVVRWPEALRSRLEGTTRVTLSSEDGVTRYDAEVTFGGGSEPLRLLDRHGHRVAVDSAGHLTRVFAETGHETRAEVIEGTRRALADLRELGYEAHLSYGCLLGAVRTGRMIGHDSDADLAYLSPYTTPSQVVLESYGMERALRSRGWRVVRMSGADLKLLHRLADGRIVHIDIFGAFHVGDTFYQLGGRSGVLPRSAVVPASTVVLEGVELPAPADPEAVLGFLYGPSWRVPDPAFQNTDPPGGLRRIEGWVRGVRHDVVGWNEFFAEHRRDVPWQPSDFARWVNDRLPAGAPVADLGCGTGRDAVFFARRDREVLAYDIAGKALSQTRRRITRAGGEPGSVRTLGLNDRRSALVAGAELARTDQPVNLYARGLLECLDAEARDHLFLVASMALRRGGALYLELSARGGLVPLPAPQPAHLVERVDVEQVVAAITARGGTVDEVVVAPGNDLLDRPDPRVARIVAHWNHPKRGES
ncbi:MAG: class I SAM-dependent methyltransferase [Marmoricola sp.]